MSHSRAISDVSCGRFIREAPTAPTKPSISTITPAVMSAEPIRRRRLFPSVSIRASVQPSARPSGWRRKAATVRVSMPSHKCPW